MTRVPDLRTARVASRLVVHDLRLLWRYGIVGATAFVSVLWLAVLYQVPADVRPAVVVWIVLLDSAILGMFFVGALLLFEREEATLAALAVAPIGPGVRIAARVTALTGLALAASVTVAFASAASLRVVPLIAGVALLSVTATLNALILAAPFRHFPDYVTLAPLGLLPLSTPVVLRAAGLDSVWLNALPGYGSVDLVIGAHQPVSVEHPVISAMSAIVWIGVFAVGARWAHQRWLRTVEVGDLATALRGLRWARPGSDEGQRVR